MLLAILVVLAVGIAMMGMCALAGMQDAPDLAARQGLGMRCYRACYAPLVDWCARHRVYRTIAEEETKIYHKPSLDPDIGMFHHWQTTPLVMHMPLNPCRWPEYTHEAQPQEVD